MCIIQPSCIQIFLSQTLFIQISVGSMYLDKKTKECILAFESYFQFTMIKKDPDHGYCISSKNKLAWLLSEFKETRKILKDQVRNTAFFKCV